MLRRLVETHHAEFQADPSAEQIRFWLRELRTEATLMELVRQFPVEAEAKLASRPLLAHASNEDLRRLSDDLRAEEDRERELDRAYWRPLRAELETLRHAT